MSLPRCGREADVPIGRCVSESGPEEEREGEHAVEVLSVLTTGKSDRVEGGERRSGLRGG